MRVECFAEKFLIECGLCRQVKTLGDKFHPPAPVFFFFIIKLSEVACKWRHWITNSVGKYYFNGVHTWYSSHRHFVIRSHKGITFIYCVHNILSYPEVHTYFVDEMNANDARLLFQIYSMYMRVTEHEKKENRYVNKIFIFVRRARRMTEV